MKDIGLFLRGKREEIGISYEEIEKRLKIRKKYIVAIEEGNLDVIPGKTYIYGYLRNYCKFINISERKIEGIINSYKEIEKQKKNIAIKREEVISLKSRRTGSLSRKSSQINFRYVYLSGFILILFAGLLFMNNYLRKAQNYPLPSPEVTTTTSSETTVESEIDSLENGDVTEEINIEPVTVEEIIVEKLPLLKLNANENTWVKVSSGDILLFEGILTKNEELRFKVKSAVKLLTIFPQKIVAYVNDEKIDFSRSTQSNQIYEYFLEEYTENS